MSNRLTRIYTRTGDDGSTGLGDGRRVPKDDPRVEAYGTVDETNSAIGLVLAVDGIPATVRTCLEDVQHDLFDLGGELSVPGYERITGDFVTRLERILDSFNADLPPLQEFILPAGGTATSACHMARAVCRRAERRAHTLARMDAVNPQAIRYLNRLSDLLFVIARVLGRHERGTETLWKRGRGAGGGTASDGQP